VDEDVYRVEMKNILNSQYLADMYFGGPESQKATVVFDTGSNWLAVTTQMCDSCKSKAYDTTKSTKKSTNNETIEQKYGAAYLSGIKYNDDVCLHSKQDKTKSDFACLENFQFMAITEESGLN